MGEGVGNKKETKEDTHYTSVNMAGNEYFHK